jgi:hypothetical protein
VAGPEAETATRIESELKAATSTRAETETGVKAGACFVLAEVITQVVAELASGLTPLLMECAAIARAEAEAEPAWWGCEWVGQLCVLVFRMKR